MSTVAVFGRKLSSPVLFYLSSSSKSVRVSNVSAQLQGLLFVATGWGFDSWRPDLLWDPPSLLCDEYRG